MSTKVLIIEDEPAIALTLRDDLELESYEVDVSHDGEEGLQLALSGRYDIILLDVMLPGRTGFDICRQVRARQLTLPIIMLTAKSSEAEKVLGLDLGADDYLTKPFSPLELRARIKALLRRAVHSEPPTRSFGEFQVDFQRMELRHADRTIDLTALEFKLLSAFLEHAGQVLSRDRLLDLVWGPSVVMTDRVIDTHVANLRRKLGEGSVHVVSVRGIGYRFDP
jgi:DNA-binding response OmpR family regulator